MAEIPFAAMRAVAERLERLGLDYAFLGGSVVGLLLDHLELSPVRQTDDVDVIIEVVSRTRYAETEAKLRELKFDHDMRPGAPRCRWVLGNLTVDIMPVEGAFLGLNTAWFREALSSASNVPIPGADLRVISPVAFLATKYVAFLDRGAGDYYASHDLEDLITVIDGRERIVAEASSAAPGLRDYISQAMAELIVASDVGTPDGRVVMVRRSSIAIPQENLVRPSIHEVWNALVRDQTRLMQIVADIEACISEGRSPLVLADRKVYLDSIAAQLHERAATPTVAQFRLQSGIGKKQRAEIRSQIDEHFAHKRPFVLLATASLIGEGFDLPQLDTLVLSMPLSFKGRLVQYVGRLHRSHEGKASPRVYDYLDENSPLTRAMFRRRLVGYRQMGYRVKFPGVDAFDANDITELM